MTDMQTTNHYEEDEISLLDILVTLAESWKLLVFGPIIAGVLAAGLSFLWPATYESVAIVRLSEEEAALLHTALVLDPLVEKFGYLQKADGNKDSARTALKSNLTFAADKKTKLLTITAKAHSGDGAQALGQAALAVLLRELGPKGKDKELLLQTIEINKQSIADNTDALESIKKNVTRLMGNEAVLDSSMKQFANLSTEISRLTLQNISLAQKLEPRGSEVYVQEPSLPQSKSAPKRSLVAVLAALAVGFGLLLFVLVGKAWRSAAQDAESAVKVAHIRQLLGMGKA
jgi:uncharacterized protein involved in exopolysaccharide biosynthesis